MDSNSLVTIRELRPEDAQTARRLILAGLEEHWGRLDPTLNPDLDDIPRAYSGAVFLTAWRGDRLLGTGALVPSGDRSGQIVRMSVARDARRGGIGRAILTALIEHARALDLRRLVLETTETWDDAVQFYLAAGFRVTHHQDGDVYFMLEI